EQRVSGTVLAGHHHFVAAVPVKVRRRWPQPATAIAHPPPRTTPQQAWSPALRTLRDTGRGGLKRNNLFRSSLHNNRHGTFGTQPGGNRRGHGDTQRLVLHDASLRALADKGNFSVPRNAQAEGSAQSAFDGRERRELPVAWQTGHLPNCFELSVLPRMHRGEGRWKRRLGVRLSLRNQEGRSFASATFTQQDLPHPLRRRG